MLDKLTTLLNIKGNEKKIAVLEIIIELATNQILAYINCDYLPEELEWVLIKIAQREYNANNSSHLISEGIDVVSQNYKQGDLLADYLPYLDAYIMNNQIEQPEHTIRKAKFL